MKNAWIILTLIVVTIFAASCGQNPRVVIITNMGEIELELFADQVPGHTENFVKLVNEEFFSGTTFHRVAPGYLIQGGDPNSKDTDPNNDGLGGPGYDIPAEIKLLHVRGSVAAARLPDHVNPEKKSNGSQFYICINDMPQLDGAYTVFGKVVRGMETVDKIGRLKTDPRQRPNRRVVMERVYVD